VQGHEVVRRLDGRVRDFEIEQAVERGVIVAGVVERAEAPLGFCPVSVDVVVAVDKKWFLFLVCERGLRPGLTLALAADSSQPVADSSLDLPDSSRPMPDSSLCWFRGIWASEVAVEPFSPVFVHDHSVGVCS
jgi:hypothetical protein